jgi:hypothetical protein
MKFDRTAEADKTPSSDITLNWKRYNDIEWKYYFIKLKL